MIKIVYECDRCGAEIPGEIGYLAWTHIDREGGDRMESNAFGGLHFCEACMEEIGAFIAGNRIPMPAGDSADSVKTQAAAETAQAAVQTAEPAETQDAGTQAAEAAGGAFSQPAQIPAEKKRGGKEIDVDWDKAEALYKAGWPCREIITEREFRDRLTEKQVYRHMYYKGLVTERANAEARQQAKEQEAGA